MERITEHGNGLCQRRKKRNVIISGLAVPHNVSIASVLLEHEFLRSSINRVSRITGITSRSDSTAAVDTQ